MLCCAVLGPVSRYKALLATATGPALASPERGTALWRNPLPAFPKAKAVSLDLEPGPALTAAAPIITVAS